MSRSAARTLAAADDAATIALRKICRSAALQKGCAFPSEHSHVGLNTAAEVTQHSADVTDQVLYMLLENAEQAQKASWHDRTLVMIDASRLGTGWIPSDASCRLPA